MRGNGYDGRVGGKRQHRLTDKDLTARTAVCAVCGPVEVLRVQRGGECANARRAQRIGYRKGPRKRSPAERARDAARRRPGPHGLTVEEARRYREGKACGICGTADTLNVDHDHATGRRRGVLCRAHNIGLGMFHDSEEELLAALDYLRRARADD